MHHLTSNRARLLAAALLASSALAACGSSSSSSTSAPSATSATSSHAAAGAPVAASTQTAAAPSSSAAGPQVAGVSLSQLNDKLKHMTPQQIADIKAKLPLYVKAQQACIKQVGQDASQVLACLHSRGY